MDGDTESLSTLVLRYKDKIYTSIYLLVKDKYLAEDIFQDSFIRIIDTLKPASTRMKVNFYHGL
jgi:RNA polymerase sigma-70 factor (ECF subfamily)